MLLEVFDECGEDGLEAFELVGGGGRGGFWDMVVGDLVGLLRGGKERHFAKVIQWVEN